MKDRANGPLFKWFGSKWQSSARYPYEHGLSVFEPSARLTNRSLAAAATRKSWFF